MDLGRKMNEPATPTEPPREDKDKVYYPSIYLSDAPEGMQDIPEEGTATIRYKISSRTVREEPGKDKKSVDISIDVMSFDPERPKGLLKQRDNPRDLVANSLHAFMLSRMQGRD